MDKKQITAEFLEEFYQKKKGEIVESAKPKATSTYDKYIAKTREINENALFENPSKEGVKVPDKQGKSATKNFGKTPVNISNIAHRAAFALNDGNVEEAQGHVQRLTLMLGDVAKDIISQTKQLINMGDAAKIVDEPDSLREIISEMKGVAHNIQNIADKISFKELNQMLKDEDHK